MVAVGRLDYRATGPTTDHYGTETGTSKNEAYVDAVARANVLYATGVIRRRSEILADLETKGALKIVGAMYDIATGVVTFLS